MRAAAISSLGRLQPRPIERAHAEHVGARPGERMPEADARPKVILHALAEDHPVRLIDLECQRIGRVEAAELDAARTRRSKNGPVTSFAPSRSRMSARVSRVSASPGSSQCQARRARRRAGAAAPAARVSGARRRRRPTRRGWPRRRTPSGRGMRISAPMPSCGQRSVDARLARRPSRWHPAQSACSRNVARVELSAAHRLVAPPAGPCSSDRGPVPRDASRRRASEPRMDAHAGGHRVVAKVGHLCSIMDRDPSTRGR